MEKINFVNGTLLSPAKVTIDGVDHPITPAVYEGKSSLNATNLNQMQDNIEKFIQLMHPIGSIYITTINTNPEEIFGFGTWEAWGSGKVPVGVDTTQTEFDTVEKTGGEKTHRLTIEEMPEHRHSIYRSGNNTTAGYGAIFQNDSTIDESNGNPISYEGGSKAHNNLQPYITCYMWKRTA